MPDAGKYSTNRDLMVRLEKRQYHANFDGVQWDRLLYDNGEESPAVSHASPRNMHMSRRVELSRID